MEGVYLNDKPKDEILAKHEKKTEITMKIVVAIVVAVLLLTLYILMTKG